MKVLKYIVIGDPRTKKNHQMIAGKGRRCPTCGKFETEWIRQGSAYNEYSEAAAWQLRPRPRAPIDFPINIRYLFFMKTRRKVDQSNLIAAMDDILTENRIIEDDNCRIIIGHDGSRVYHDPNHPRTEIYITRAADDYEQLTL